jgi:hypothetical protein
MNGPISIASRSGAAPPSSRTSVSVRSISARIPIRLAVEGARGRAAESRASHLDRGDRQDRGVEHVAHLVGEHAQALVRGEGAIVLLEHLAAARELGDRARDGVVEADVEDAELVHADRHLLLDRELGDRLAQVAIVVHHLLDGVIVPQQLGPVPDRAVIDHDLGGRSAPAGGRGGVAGSVIGLEHVRELVEEERHAVGELGGGDERRAPGGNLPAATLDQLAPVDLEEFVQHRLRVGSRLAPVCTLPNPTTAACGPDGEAQARGALRPAIAASQGSGRRRARAGGGRPDPCSEAARECPSRDSQPSAR